MFIGVSERPFLIKCMGGPFICFTAVNTGVRVKLLSSICTFNEFVVMTSMFHGGMFHGFWVLFGGGAEKI